jgi:hypothetical protein
MHFTAWYPGPATVTHVGSGCSSGLPGSDADGDVFESDSRQGHMLYLRYLSLTSRLPLHERLINLTHSPISQHQVEIMTTSKSLPPRTDLMRWDEEADEPYILLPSHPDLRLTPWRETDVEDAVSCDVVLATGTESMSSG